MRASLLAKATAATLRWVRAVSWANQALRPEDCFALCCRTARAPCTKSRRLETGVIQLGRRSLPGCPDFCPACPLCGCYSLASSRRDGSLFPTGFSRAQIDFPERCECSAYAV